MSAVGGPEPIVVVVEDDPHIADLVEMYLRRDGYRVHQAATAERALEVIRDRRPRLVIVDIGLPGELDGLDVCRHLRERGGPPVILLTARDAEVDRVLGLELGADDYVVKPFSPRELVARVKAVLRRAEGADRRDDDQVREVGAVRVDLRRREVRVDDHPVPLTTRELDLLAHLAANAGTVLTRRQIVDAVWGVDWEGDERTVDVHVRQLRRKVGDALPLTTVWGVGYRLG